MKRSERHRLKENEFALSVSRLRQSFHTYKREITLAAIGALVVVVAVVGLFLWRGRVNSQSRAMLAAAMAIQQAQVVPPQSSPAPGTEGTPAVPIPPPPGSYPSERAKLEAALPKFLAAAEQYPSSEPGIAARYHAAAALAALNRSSEAIQRYREVIERAGNGLYSDMARLGLANTEAAAGQFDLAIGGYRELAAKTDGRLPVDGILMQLGYTYTLAGKGKEAQQTYQRLVDEFPQSPYASVARRELDSAKSTGAD